MIPCSCFPPDCLGLHSPRQTRNRSKGRTFGVPSGTVFRPPTEKGSGGAPKPLELSDPIASGVQRGQPLDFGVIHIRSLKQPYDLEGLRDRGGGATEPYLPVEMGLTQTSPKVMVKMGEIGVLLRWSEIWVKVGVISNRYNTVIR